MNLQNFENVVRSGLRNQEVPLDTDKLITNLFSPQKPARRIAFFWWFTGMITILSGIGIFLFIKGQGNGQLMEKSCDKIVVEEAKIKRAAFSTPGIVDSERDNQLISSDRNQKEKFATLTSEHIHNNSKINKKNLHNSVAGQVGESTKEIITASLTNETFPNQIIETSEKISSLSIKSPVSLEKPKRPGRKKVECPTFSNKKKISMFVQPEFGMSIPQKTLTENIPDNSEATAYRKSHEKTLEGIHAGLVAGCFIGSTPLYVYTGLGYSRLTEKLDLTYQYTRLDTTFGIISITQSQTGDTVTVVYGDIVTESTISGQKIKHHQFQSFDIPLCVGYQFALGQKWNANIEGGILFNISLKATGQILQSLHDFKPVIKNEYHSSLGLGYRLGAGIEYLAFPSLGIGLQARVQGYGKSFSNMNAGFQQKYIIPGGNLYLRYYFSL